MKVKQITESTTAGAVATVAAPLGGTQKRAGSMFKGKKTNKPFYEDGTEVSGLVPAEKVVKGKAKKKGPYANSMVAEGKVKELSQDLKELSDTEFKKKYGKTKAEWRALLKNNKAKVDESTIHISSKDPLGNERHIHRDSKGRVFSHNQHGYQTSLSKHTFDHPSVRFKTPGVGDADREHDLRTIINKAKNSAHAAELLNASGYGYTNWRAVDEDAKRKLLNPEDYVDHPDRYVRYHAKGAVKEKAKLSKPSDELMSIRKIDYNHHMTQLRDQLKQLKSEQNKKSKVDEAEINEQDLIVVPGMRRMKDKSFISHKEDRRDHEVEMARSDLYATAKNAMRIFDLLKDRSEEEGLMGWQQSYITLAADYLNSVADSIEYNAKVKGELDEMTGGVIAGGMSNFEEDTVNELSPATKKSYAALAKQDKEFNQRGIDQALSRAAADQHPGSAEWEDEAKFLQSVNAKRSRGLARAGVSEDSNELDQQALGIADKLTTGKNLEKLRGKVYDSTVYRALDRYFEKHNIPETIYNRVAQIVFQRINQQGVSEAEKQGLWANIHAKRERIKHGSGERMRKPGSKGAPTAQAFKQSQATSKK